MKKHLCYLLSLPFFTLVAIQDVPNPAAQALAEQIRDFQDVQRSFYPHLMALEDTSPCRLKLEAAQFPWGFHAVAVAQAYYADIIRRTEYGIHHHPELSPERARSLYTAVQNELADQLHDAAEAIVVKVYGRPLVDCYKKTYGSRSARYIRTIAHKIITQTHTSS